ncbi:MAG: hypothetical protein GC149_19850 [Gammaproteobacteria bacterium]|nr:hypothetical protein [Gammaproteobacteria bacterium]
MKTNRLKPLCLAIGLTLTGSALAVDLDFSGSDIYMKFLDGDHRIVSSGSIDTASGADQGQFTELELHLTAKISRQVEAGARILSRSSGSYWSEFGGFADENTPIKAKNMKLRGAYIDLTPGYAWMDYARLGSSDWGMFDPFTVGKMRYIDRDNINGVYLRGPLPRQSSNYDLAWISLAQYLGPNFTTSDDSSTTGLRQNDGTYIAQFRVPVSGARVTASVQQTTDHDRSPDTTPYDQQAVHTRFKNQVMSLRGEGSPTNGFDLRGAYYYSKYYVDVSGGVQNWSNLLGADYNDDAWLLTADWQTPVQGFGVSMQLFNIGAGYVTAVGARRESDVLLTEGNEAAWYGWGDPKYIGGQAADFQQVPVTIRDNDFMDFDENPAESAIGWKGVTLLLKYEVANSPLSLELTHLDYNQNWQNWGGQQTVFDVINWAGATGPNFKQNSDRKTNIFVFKVNHVFQVAGGLDTSFKWKRVIDKDKGDITIATDDLETTDNGVVVSVGNQLFNDLYGSVSFGRYSRDITLGANQYNNDKDIISLRFAYNLTGFELGMLAQWINGTGDPQQTGTQIGVEQYRMKAFTKVIF